MPAGQKKVAKILFEDPSKIAFKPAFEIGNLVNASESTVIRLSQTLGYKGYAELQEFVQKEITKGRTVVQHQEISNIGKEQPFFKTVMAEDISNIQSTMNDIPEETIEEAVKLISEAKNVYIIGNLSTYGLAHFFAHWMNTVFRNVEMINYGDPRYYTQISNFNSDTVIISIVFPRYAKSTMETVKYGKQRGAKVVAITDSELSPVHSYADIMLKTVIHSKINIDSYLAPMSLINAIMRSVTIKNSQRVEENLKEIEKVYKDNDVFHSE